MCCHESVRHQWFRRLIKTFAERPLILISPLMIRPAPGSGSIHLKASIGKLPQSGKKYALPVIPPFRSPEDPCPFQTRHAHFKERTFHAALAALCSPISKGVCCFISRISIMGFDMPIVDICIISQLVEMS